MWSLADFDHDSNIMQRHTSPDNIMREVDKFNNIII